MLRSLIIGLPVFLALDFVWLGFVAKGFYATQLDSLLRKAADGSMAPLWAPALIFYALVVVGLAVFVLPKVGEDGSLLMALGWGALFGLIVYGAWDLTNYSVLKEWPVAVVFADLAWGMAICGITAVAMTAGVRATA